MATASGMPSSDSSTNASAYRFTPAIRTEASDEDEGGHQVRLAVEPAQQVFGDAADPGAVVERHHHHAEEHHGRHRADPVVVHGADAVLGSVRRHGEDLDRAQVGRDERDPGDPGRQRAAGQEEVRRGLDQAAQREPDPDDEDEVDDHQRVVQRRQRQAQPGGQRLRNCHGHRCHLGRPAGRGPHCRIAAVEQRDAGALVQLLDLRHVGLGDQARPGQDRPERVLAVSRLERGDLDRHVPLQERLLVDDEQRLAVDDRVQVLGRDVEGAELDRAELAQRLQRPAGRVEPEDAGGEHPVDGWGRPSARSRSRSPPSSAGPR